MKELFEFSEHDQGTKNFKQSDLYRIVQGLREEFSLTNWEWLAQQLDILCFSAYGAEVNASVLEENSWHKVSELTVSGDRYWNDNNSASFDWWKGTLFIKWETSSHHEVSFHFSLDILGDGDDKYNWILKGISFGTDESENFYPLVKRIVQKCVADIDFSNCEIPKEEVMSVLKHKEQSPEEETEILLKRLVYLGGLIDD